MEKRTKLTKLKFFAVLGLFEQSAVYYASKDKANILHLKDVDKKEGSNYFNQELGGYISILNSDGLDDFIEELRATGRTLLMASQNIAKSGSTSAINHNYNKQLTFRKLQVFKKVFVRVDEGNGATEAKTRIVAERNYYDQELD